MSLLGKWRIVEMPDYDAGYADMMDPPYIHFRENGSGEFAFGCAAHNLLRLPRLIAQQQA